MKTKTILNTLISLLILNAIVFQACKKETTPNTCGKEINAELSFTEDFELLTIDAIPNGTVAYGGSVIYGNICTDEHLLVEGPITYAINEQIVEIRILTRWLTTNEEWADLTSSNDGANTNWIGNSDIGLRPDFGDGAAEVTITFVIIFTDQRSPDANYNYVNNIQFLNMPDINYWEYVE
jgi:hypothetical protein